MQLVPGIKFSLYESTEQKFQNTVDSAEMVALEKINDDIGQIESVNMKENNCDILGRLFRTIEKIAMFAFLKLSKV